MSYILQALKKSQQDRELGQVPTLTTASDGPSPIPPQRINPWSFGALILALSAILIALYGTFGEQPRLGGDQTQPLPQPALHPQTGKASADTETGGSRASQALLASPPPSPTPISRTGNPERGPTDIGIGGLPAAEPNGKITGGQDLKRRSGPTTPTIGGGSQTAAKSTIPAAARKQGDADALVSQSDRSFAGEQKQHQLTDPVPPKGWERYSKFLRSEAEKLRKRLATVDTSPTHSSARGAKRPLPAQAVTSAVPAQAPAGDRKPRSALRSAPGDAVNQGLTPSGNVAARTQPPLAMQLPVEIYDALPNRQIIAHIYTKEPKRRFIIVNSSKLHEGETNVNGLMLEEVRPDGIVFQFRKHRFFEPR